jgi:hypothetical protein
MAFVILYLLPKIEKHIKDDWYSDFTVQLDPQLCSAESIADELKSFGLRVKRLDIEADLREQRQRITFHLRYKKGDELHLPLQVTERVSRLPGVQTTQWRE